MSRTENVNEYGMDGNQPDQQPGGEQAMEVQPLPHVLSEIEEQGQRVAMALQAVAEALDNSGNVSLEMISHLKAQLLKAHLHLDDLEQWLDSIG
jgi:hypothetical protein